LELLVVSVLMLLLTMSTGQMWSYFFAESTNLADRTRAASELRMAVTSISDDMGSVVWAAPVGQTLVVCRLGPPGQDDVTVEYAVTNNQLVRTEQVTGLSVPLADHLTSMEVENVTASLLRVTLTVNCGKTTREATLYWSRT
jgi:hypothetical protein